MRRITRWILLGSYYYSQLLGILRFAYNYKKPQVRRTRFITVYSVVVNLLIFVMALMLYYSNLATVMRIKAREFHHMIFIAMTLIRAVTVLTMLLSNWTQRREIIAVVRDFIWLRRQCFSRFKVCPHVMRRYESNVIRKFAWAMLADLSMWAMILDAVRSLLDCQLFLAVTVLFLLINALNVMTNHFYFAMLNVNFHYSVLNDELVRILHATRELSEQQKCHPHRRGTYITQCCRLADDVDVLAISFRYITNLAKSVVTTFGLQGICMVSNMQLSNIGMIYMGYEVSKLDMEGMGFSTWGGIILLTAIVSYYYDQYVFLGVMTDTLKLFKTSAELLRQQVHHQLLDERLEQAFKDLWLQFARDPFEIKVLTLFTFNKGWVFSSFGLTLTNSIILMQYDYKYHT